MKDGKYWMCKACKIIVQRDEKPKSCDCGGTEFTWTFTLETVYSGNWSGFVSKLRKLDNTESEKE